MIFRASPCKMLQLMGTGIFPCHLFSSQVGKVFSVLFCHYQCARICRLPQAEQMKLPPIPKAILKQLSPSGWPPSDKSCPSDQYNVWVPSPLKSCRLLDFESVQLPHLIRMYHDSASLVAHVLSQLLQGHCSTPQLCFHLEKVLCIEHCTSIR